MGMKMEGIILSANKYRIQNPDGSINMGVSIQIYPDDNMNPYQEGEDVTSKGHKVVEDSLPVEAWNDIKSVPGVYEMKIEMRAAKNKNNQSKGQLKVVEVKYIKELSASPPHVVGDKRAV